MSLILAANFIAEKRFEFLGNYFPEVDVQAKLDDVETNYFPDPTIELWGSSRPEGVKLMTAHLLTIDMMNAAQVASMAVNLQAGGGVTFQKLPNIEVCLLCADLQTYGANTDKKDCLRYLLSGKQYLQ